MSSNRRDFLKIACSTTAASAAFSSISAQAEDPFAPAEAGLAQKLFNTGKQHVIPPGAFTVELTMRADCPRPVKTASWIELSGGESRQATVQPFAAIKDPHPIGKVLNGVAAEWNGRLIGGHFKYDSNNQKWIKPNGYYSAWSVMRDRVTPDTAGEYGISDLGNWGKFGASHESNGHDSLVRCYSIDVYEKLFRPFINGVKNPTLLYCYGGLLPGPTFRFRHGMPTVVRFNNHLPTEISIHHHGGHNPTHADGFPSYYVLQGESRDYLYPNILPLRINEEGKTEIDFGEGQSTTWYHDHGLDATAFNVSHGLAGFALWYDELELELIRKGVLPGLYFSKQSGATTEKCSISGYDPDIEGEKEKLKEAWETLERLYPNSDLREQHDRECAAEKAIEEKYKNNAVDRYDAQQRYYPVTLTPYYNPYDLPLVLQDRILNPETGQVVYDSNGHNGYIGGIQLISGVAWPVIKVKRRKYRLRLLDGSNARIYRLRFLDAATLGMTTNPDGSQEPRQFSDLELEQDSKSFFRIGKDSWLFSSPTKVKDVLLSMANRADLIIDFGLWYEQARKAQLLNSNGQAEFYLVNTMPQFDGRGPKSKLAENAGDPNVFPLPFTLDPANPIVANMANTGVVPAEFLAAGLQAQLSETNQPIALVKFIVENDPGIGDDATLDESTILRPRHAIKDEEVMAVREFVFERGKGAWMINGRFYDPTISNASPIIGIKGQNFRVPDPTVNEVKPSLGYAEEWILRNGGGGWWHPIHIHLEGHQLVAYEKDFEADALVGADGILGARAQARMARLPNWPDLVGRFGFDTLPQSDAVKAIREMILSPKIEDLPTPVAESKPIQILLRDPSAGAQLLPAIRQSDKFKQAIQEIPEAQKNQVLQLLDALEAIRLKWATNMVGNHDTQILGPNTIARIRMRFRTWPGPLVFHCHNVEHEDMRMMVNFEATMSGSLNEVNTIDPNVYPTARSHGQDVTDLETNPAAAGELPWDAIDGFPHFKWSQKPIPGSTTTEAGNALIKPREPKKK